MRALIAALMLSSLLLCLAAPCALAEDEKPQPHADDVVKAAIERFKEEFKDPDMDNKIRILKWLGMHRHKSVVKALKKVFLKNKDLELQTVAAAGLGHQVANPKDATRVLLQGIEKYEKYATRAEPSDEEELDQELEATVLATTVRALAKMPWKPDKKQWKAFRGLIDHNHDEVAIAMMNWCGETKEWRSLPIILEWFNYYPDGYSWSGGSVSVDTGAAGNKDAKAAKAKWMAKYGRRAKKARPKAHEAMRKALKAITGVEFKKAEELKVWMKENKLLLRKHGV